MKILAISDEVVDFIYSPQIKEKYADVDLVLGCGALGLLLFWVVPSFLPAFFFLMALGLVPTLTYVYLRNQLVPPPERVLTPQHIKMVLNNLLRRKAKPLEALALPGGSPCTRNIAVRRGSIPNSSRAWKSNSASTSPPTSAFSSCCGIMRASISARATFAIHRSCN